jgi:general nucleoside transport system permease protein
MTTLQETVTGARRLTEPRWVGIIGIAFGVLAIWLTLPPWTTEALGFPIAAGFFGAAAGIYAVTRDERRLGWWAIGVSVLGTAGALWLQARDEETLTAIFSTGLIAAMLRFATPLAFAAIGGVLNERSGVVNIGLEGMMLAGAFFGIWATAWSGSWVVGVLMAMAFGGLFALIHAFFSIHLRADQIVVGFAINFLALGLTGYLFRSIYGTQGTPSNVDRIPDVTLPAFFRDIPFIGDIFGQLNLMIWLMLALVVLAWVVLFRTPVGLRLRSVGEHPRAADTVGVNVYLVRYVAVVASGMLAALGGAYLSIGFTGTFNENMTAGRGFIALAAVILGKWSPLGAFGACLLFGFGFAISIPLQREADISANLLSTLPYVLTLIALVGVIGRSIPPAAVGRPYAKQ